MKDKIVTFIMMLEVVRRLGDELLEDEQFLPEDMTDILKDIIASTYYFEFEKSKIFAKGE